MEGALCPVCAEFEPQTWRKSLCKNCFHGLDEHTDDEDGSQERGARTAKSDSSPAETQPKTVSKEPTKQTQKGGAGTSSVTKQEPASQPSPKSTKTTSKPSATAALSAKFGPSVGKSRDSVKNDAGKSAGKPLSTPAPEPPSPAKSSPELTKRGHTTPARQTTDVRGTSKYTGTDRKQNGSDPKLKTNGSKGVSSTSAKTCTDSKKPGDVKQETRSHSSEAGQTSKTDNIKPVGRAASGVSKVKHLLKSFGSEDEAPDVHIEKKEPKETGRVGEKPATLSDSDVTTKCQAVEKKDTFSKSSISSTVREHHGTKAAHEFGLSFAAKPSTGNGKTAKSIGKRDNGTQVHSAKSPVPGSTAASRRLVDSKVDDKTEGEFKGKVETKLKVESKDLKSKEQDAKSKEKEIKDSKDREQELKDLRAKEEELKDLRIKIHEFQAKEKELQDLRVRDQELKAKEKELTSLKAKVDELKNLQSKEQELKLKEKEFKELKAKENELRDIRAKERDLKSKEQELKTQELEGKKLKSKFAEMEERCKKLSEENETLKKRAHQNRKEEMERLLSELRGQLSTMETRCAKVETDNAVLLGKLKEQEACVKKDQHGSKELGDLEQKLMDTEDDCEDLTEENLKLKDEIVELRKEMDEMYDGFRENEVEEFRDLQKELELTAKNCRILQFKLRKAERKNEQVEADRMHYEDRLRLLQNQFESEETRTHIQALEEELRMAKEVSVRLHDELDIVEDKRSKADEENRHLTGLLEQTDKKQFRMEMEIDKLRDQIMDLKNELKYASSNKSESSERKSMRQ